MKRFLSSCALVALVALLLNGPSAARAGIIASNPSSPDSSGGAVIDDANIRLTLSQSPLPNVFTYVDFYGPSGQTPHIDFNITYDRSTTSPETVSGIESIQGLFSSYRFSLPSAMTTFPVVGNYVVELRNMTAASGFYADAPNVPFLSTNPSLLIGLIDSGDPSNDRIYDGSQFQFTLGAVGTPAGVPEIDPATGGSALSLVAGVLAMIEQRRRRATLVA